MEEHSPWKQQGLEAEALTCELITRRPAGEDTPISY